MSSSNYFSSNAWIGAGKSYVKTKTSQQTNNSVVSHHFQHRRNENILSSRPSATGPEISQVLIPINIQQYNLKHHLGTEFIDTVTLGGLVVTNQSIGVASTVSKNSYERKQ